MYHKMLSDVLSEMFNYVIDIIKVSMSMIVSLPMMRSYHSVTISLMDFIFSFSYR